MGETFKYFSYGSNLLKERILIKNPSSKFCCLGVLSGFKLGFARPGDMPGHQDIWQGAAATIHASEPESLVRGCVWDIKVEDLESLNQQECFYTPLQVDVKVESGETVSCRTYKMTHECSDPERNIPNPFYVKVMIDGAKQHGFPEDYIKALENFPTNGKTEPPPLYQDVMKKIEEFRKAHNQ